jgi:hypothetical protein
MKLVITIEMDNAAFEDEPAQELEKMLSDVTDSISCNQNIYDYKVGHWDTLRDSNGNRVGSVDIIN